MEASAYASMFAIEDRLWWYRGRRRICFDLLDHHLQGRSDLEVLDVGCGTGYNLTLLQRYGHAQGVDMAPEALEFCRQRGLTNVTLHTAGELPFPDSSFDLLTAFDVIEHIEDDRAALLEFSRVLRPGGWLLIYTPALPWLYNEHDRIVHHKRRYRRAELREKLLGANYRLLQLAYSNMLVLPLVLLARALAKLGPPGRHQEMEMPHPFVNAAVGALCQAEAPLVQRAMLPIGMSLVALARKGFDSKE
jgi:SAM-dependent methyltransferase